MSNNEHDVGRIGIWKAVSLVFSLVLAVSSALLGWLCVGVIDHEIRLTRQEEHSRNVDSKLHNIPPAWFKDIVYENKRRLEALEKAR